MELANETQTQTDVEVVVMVICDNEELLNLFKKVFVSLNCNCEFKTNAKDAIDDIKFNPPDIVLIDLNMKESDSLKIVKKIRDFALTEDSYITLISDNHASRQITEAFHLGVDDYIVSPFKPIQLKTKITYQIKKFTRQRENLHLITEDLFKMKAEVNKTLEKLDELEAKTTGTSPVLDSDDTVKFKKEIENKQKDIERLSNIISERSKMTTSESKSQKAHVDKEKQTMASIKKTKTDLAKKELEKHKKLIVSTYSHLDKVSNRAIGEATSLLVGIESSLKTKDDIMNTALRKIFQHFELMLKELVKYKKLYFQTKEDSKTNSAIDYIEEEYAEKLKSIQKHTQDELNEPTMIIAERQRGASKPL